MFGVKDTLACLEMGAVETLIVWENLDMQRYVFTNPTTGAPRHTLYPQPHPPPAAAPHFGGVCRFFSAVGLLQPQGHL